MQKTVWDRIEEARSRWNVLEHPFYVAWSSGALSEDQLAHYSGQYRQAVEAIAGLSGYVAGELPDRPELADHAREEAEHVSMWDGFVDAVGGERAATANPETADCVAEWTREDGAVAALARLYAIESGQPDISRTKLEGLAEHYGVPEGPGTEYFTVHRGRDVEHAAEGRELLASLLAADPEAAEGAVEAAEAAMRANWKLLDGVN
ncbi:MAG TPA: iron-containing redox enzyme family protein [Solirubrobacterales bacterium]|nr:iron-containing redox enzyme family protein [Solirubrobacterales bacterium]